MLFRFFRNVIRNVSKSSKAVYFWRIRHGCGIIFGKSSKKHKSCSYGDDDENNDDGHDYAPTTYLERGGDDDDGDYDYAPVALT